MRHLGTGYSREETLAEHAVDILAAQRGLDSAADEAGTFSQNGDWLLFGARTWREQLFLTNAAIVPEGMELEGIDARAFFRQFAGDEAGQREIHIVATK